VIGKDAGQGATLTCRELAVWDREQDGKFSLGDAPAPAGTKPSKDAD